MRKYIDAKVVSMLLKFGAKPNLAFGTRTPWENALSYMNQDLSNDEYNLDEWALIINILLDAGADPEACGGGAPQMVRVKQNDVERTIVKHEWSAEEILKKRFADRKDLLDGLLEDLVKTNSSRLLRKNELSVDKSPGGSSFRKRLQAPIRRK